VKHLNSNYNHKTSILKLSPKKNFSHYLPKNIGHSKSPSYLIKAGVHFPNTLNKIGKLYTIGIKIKPSSTINLLQSTTTNYERDKFAPFNVNVYNFDSKSNLPSTKYLVNDTLVQLEKGDDILILDLSKLNIPFGKDGVFITLEKLTESRYNELGFPYGPSFGIVGVSEHNLITPFTLNQRIENTVWQKDIYLIEKNNTYDIEINLGELREN
jgi:hypothetical protein